MNFFTVFRTKSQPPPDVQQDVLQLYTQVLYIKVCRLFFILYKYTLAFLTNCAIMFRWCLLYCNCTAQWTGSLCFNFFPNLLTNETFKKNSSEFSIEKDMILVLKNLKGNSMSVGKGGMRLTIQRYSYSVYPEQRRQGNNLIISIIADMFVVSEFTVYCSIDVTRRKYLAFFCY